ncbi:MAG: ABC transporter permease [Bacteroidetes bacterium]|nr:ABC transporter permease [Bacteroidota bacterium]
MGKIGIIIWREYITRVKNKTFVIMCFLLPVLMGGMILVTQRISEEENVARTIVVVDASGMPDSLSYAHIFHDTADLKFNFNYIYKSLGDVKKVYKDSSHVSILWIPDNFMGGGDTTENHSVGMTVKLVSTSEPGVNTINMLESVFNDEIQRDNMRVNHISHKAVDLALKKVAVADEVNGTTKGDIKAMVGLAFGFIIYMYILMFGVQIMRSVVEEKMTRIVEVIISSVKPFQLMLGKIIGVTMVGITQFLIWMILSMAIVVPVVNSVNADNVDYTKAMPHQIKNAIPITNENSILSIDPTEKTKEVIATIMTIPWGNLIPAFLFYFLFGYFLYASIFAAIGSAADVDADTQQFTLPVTIPLIIAMMSCVTVINDPNGHIAKILSMIPFTSPIIMLIRIPFGGVGIFELLLSFAILIVTFLAMTWISGRIYRVGILMYGKKASWKEIGKWIFYKA